MRIVVLDGYTLNPGDLSWEPLRALGELVVHDRTPAEQVVGRSAGAEALLINKIALDAATLEKLPALKYIGVLATGYNVVDTAAATRRGIVVTNIPGYGTTAVAQHAMALLLELTNHVGLHAAQVRQGRWSASPDWCYWDEPIAELAGMNMGIIGYGAIGRAVGRMARALEMRVLAHDQMPPRPGDDAERVELDDLLKRSDVISLHCPLTPQTQHLINAERLRRMKPTALLINTARGPLIDEPALAEALNAGRIGGAGLDVLAQEPPPPDHPLLTAKNCIITPHQAWASRASRQRLLDMAVENVRAFVDGKPTRVVNPPAGGGR